jgi:hypothetical protein
MMKIAVEFYKEFFRKKDRGNVSLGYNFWENGEKVTQEENDLLYAPFSIEEIKYAIDSCYAEGAPGPDGLPVLFYRKFWEIVKNNIVAMHVSRLL